MKLINFKPLQLCLFAVVNLSLLSYSLAMEFGNCPLTSNCPGCAKQSTLEVVQTTRTHETTAHPTSFSMGLRDVRTDLETQSLLLNSSLQERKVALVTGATQGIGFALTLEILGRGIDVIGLARDGTKLLAMKNENTASKSNNPRIGAFNYICVDLSKICDEQIQGDLQINLLQCLKGTRKVKYLIHNAAVITPLGTEVMIESPIVEIQRTLTLNIMAPILLTRLLSDYYTDGSRILYVSSIAGDRPGGQTSLYSISKAAGDRFIQTQQKDKPRKGTLFFASVNPGNVETNIHSRDLRTPQTSFSRASYFQQFEGKLTSPEIVAQYLAWLLLVTENDVFTNESKNWDMRKHNIYEKDQQKLWWRGEELNDPYASLSTVSQATPSKLDVLSFPLQWELPQMDMPLNLPPFSDDQLLDSPQGGELTSVGLGNPKK